jgi:predicted metal-dependent peptidase
VKSNLCPADKMVRGRAELIMLHPFFGTLALRLDMIPEPGLKGARTDGCSLRYDPEYVEGLTVEQTTGLIAATVMHPAMLHHTRRGHRDKDKWNLACDYAVGDILQGTQIVTPEPMPSNAAWQGYTAEHIYNLLPDQPKGGKGKGKGKGDSNGGAACGGVDDSPSSGNKTDLECDEREWKETLAQAATVAKQQGNLPAGIQRLMDDLMQSTVDWKQRLIRFMNEKAPDDFSWARPNRRHIATGLYLPNMTSTATGEIAVVIDTSGSIGEKELNEFGGEISAIIRDLKPRKTYVIYCDAAVNKVVTFGPHDELRLEAVGGGGTDFRPPFQWLDANGITPRCLVYLTDGYGAFPEEDAVRFPTLWAINNDQVTAPWGETVQIEV